MFSGIDVEIEPGNPLSVGVYARAAQGTSVQDVTIYAGSGLVGLDGGAGSGGSHINVTVIGGQIGARFNSSQPAPTVTGLTLINQTVAAIQYGHPGRQVTCTANLNYATCDSLTLFVSTGRHYRGQRCTL